jgi:hypothetical protein
MNTIPLEMPINLPISDIKRIELYANRNEKTT